MKMKWFASSWQMAKAFSPKLRAEWLILLRRQHFWNGVEQWMCCVVQILNGFQLVCRALDHFLCWPQYSLGNCCNTQQLCLHKAPPDKNPTWFINHDHVSTNRGFLKKSAFPRKYLSVCSCLRWIFMAFE